MFKRINKNWSFVARNFTHKCLCVLCTILVVFSNAVPAHAAAYLGAITAAAEAGNTVGELFGMVLEDFFGLNHQCTLTEATLITINRSLDAIFTNTYAYDIVNPYSGSSGTYHRTGATFGEMLADMNNSIATLGTRYLSTLVSNSNGISQLTSDIKTINSNIYVQESAQTTFLGSLENLQLKEAYNSTVLYDSRYSERYIRPGVNCSVSLSNGEFQLTNFNGTYPAQSTFTIPMYQNQYTFVRFEIYTPKVLTISPLIYGNISDSFIVPSNSWITITSYKQPSFYGSNSGGFYISDSTLTSSDVVKIRNVQYISSPDLDINNKILDSVNNIQVSVDTTDIVDAIDDLSLVDNDVKLTPVIDVDLPTNGTNIVNRLRLFFSTGVSVTEFFNGVDNAETGWFTQENSDVINTLSGGYVNLYE